MKQRKKRRWLSTLAMTVLIVTLLGTSALAGSDRSYYNCTFNGAAGYDTCSGYKSDATQSGGGYANTRMTGGLLNGNGVTFWVLNASGYQATGSITLYSLNREGQMYYLSGQLYNGTKDLVISTQFGVDGCSGYWCP